MPHRHPPPISIPLTQTRLDKYWTRKNTIPHKPQPTIETHTTPQPNLNKETDPIPYRHPAIYAVTFNTRGMHTTILNLHRILNSKSKPTILYLTETKHSHIKSTWREALTEYKLTHTSPKLDPTTNRRLAGTILATRRDMYKDITPIQTPAHLTDYVKAATITPHDGSPIIAITA